jgi:uncharacterized damage-inducible protein DinB
MSTKALLTSLLRYKAAANAELVEAIALLPQTPALAPALRILNHNHVVDRIFAAHMTGEPHGYADSWSDEVPSLGALAADIRTTDDWYPYYLSTLDDEALAEPVDFTFTDGEHGRMTRAEILAHVVTHSGYHRAEIGRLLPEIRAVGARDVFAGYLHRAEPARRQQQ